MSVSSCHTGKTTEDMLKIFQHFLAHSYSGKVTKVFFTILSGFGARG